ncbi:MAG: hypothetical protein ACTHKP_00935 [Nitrososphaeraceae archaeon]
MMGVDAIKNERQKLKKDRYVTEVTKDISLIVKSYLNLQRFPLSLLSKEQPKKSKVGVAKERLQKTIIL